MSTIKEHITAKINSALNKLGLDIPAYAIERPKEESHGDLSTNAAMMLAKPLKKNPRELAGKIIESLDMPDAAISKVEIAGPGFINFFINNDFYKSELGNILKDKSAYGKFNMFAGKTADLEWVSANPTGPLHLGHGRQIALGKAVANLLEWSGYKVTREYYYNDAGKQMDNLSKSVYAAYRRLFEPDYPLPEDCYAGDYINDIAEFLKSEYADKLINTPEDPVLKLAGEDWCFKSIINTLKKLGIKHDIFFNETSLYESGAITEALEYFKTQGLSYEKDGATWLKTSELLKNKKDAEDKVIVKSTGEPTYRMPDIVYHANKIKRGFDFIIDIFGADHGDTYKEVLAGVEALGYDSSKIKVIIHQMVTFVQDGKPVKMSKRSGNAYSLDDLIDEIGADVAQFFFVMRGANTHLEFDIALAKEQSDKNPVFYLQYAHARICSILRNAKDVMPEYESSDTEKFNLLNEADEINLLKVLSSFGDNVESAALTLEPHKIITFLNQVAENYHRFYHNNRVIDLENKPLSYQRLMLCEAAKTVLKNGFDIIGISAPERM